MSILKKVFIGAVLLATASFVVAEDDENSKHDIKIGMNASGFAPVLGPESYTSSTTQGRFGLDVDDYMDVNSWSGVNFDKGFGFLSYNSGVNNGISLGYATHLFGAYVGLWFAGHGGDFTLSSTLRTPSGYQGDKEFLSYSTLDNGVYALAVLLGKGDKGLKATLVYDPHRGGSSYAFTDDGYKQGENYLLYADLALGVGDTKNYHVGFYADVARDGSTKGVDNGTFYDLYAGIGGLPFLFGFGVDLDTRLRIFSAEEYAPGESNDKKSREGELDIIAKADISRGFTFAPIDRLAVKAKVGLPVEFGIHSPEGDGYKIINVDLVINPVAKVGLQYALRPEKVNFNLGTKLELGELGLNIYNDSNNTTLAVGYNSDAIDLEFSSGFTLFLGKSITLDADWGIIDALVGKNLESGSAFNGNNSVDEAVGKILFNKFSLLLSVKL